MIITSQPHTPNISHILHDTALHYCWQGQGLLSIKTFFSGQALYSLGKGYCVVDDSSYLIVNHDQLYTITIDALDAVESFCLFFAPGLVEEVYSCLTTATTTLLDNRPSLAPLHFFERTYRHDELLSPLLFSLRSSIADRRYEPSQLEESFHALLQRLLQVHYNVYKEVEALPALRATTREELYRRLYRARDYVQAFFDTPLTLSEMAQVASLSPNHFLRTFKQLFHQTPHQYLITKRLERAQHLLISTEQPVTEIAIGLGFESLSSFSWQFRQRVGCSPTVYRAKKGDF